MSEIGLRNCPFCGGEAEVERYGTSRQSHIVVCLDCGCCLEANEESHFRNQAWNTRVTDSVLDEIVGKIKKLGEPLGTSPFTDEFDDGAMIGAERMLDDVLAIINKHRGENEEDRRGG